MWWEWIKVVPLVAAMAVFAVWPSYFWLRATRLPSFVAGVLAPAATVFFLIPLGIAYNRLGIFWSGARVLPALALIGLCGFLIYWKLRPVEVARNQSRAGLLNVESSIPWGRLFWIAVLVGWIVAVLPMVVAAPPNNPIQQWDPSFHMNGVWGINQLGKGNFGEGLAHNYVGATTTNYPLGWHIFTALFSTPATVVPTANAMTMALMLLWVVGAAAYTRMLFPSRVAWVAAPILAGGMLSMPADGLGAYSQWPNAAALALLPGLACILILLGRKLHVRWEAGGKRTNLSASWRQLLNWAIIWACSLVGTILVHPSAAFNLLVLLLPAVIGGGIRLWVIDARRKFWVGTVLWPVLAIVGVLVLRVILYSEAVLSMGDYPRAGVSWKVALGNFLTPSPPYSIVYGLIAWLTVIAVLMLIGVLAIALSGHSSLRGSRWEFSRARLPAWPIWSFLTFSFLVLLAYGSNSALREVLVAPWFLDARRIMEPQNLAMVPLAALGFAWLVRQIANAHSRRTTIAVGTGLMAVLLAVTAGGAFDARLAAARSVYDPTQLGKPGMATAGELEMLRTLDDILPPDARVLGDPQNGAVYVSMIGQRWGFFQQLTLSATPGQNEKLFVSAFNQIHENPAVCKALKEEGITHFYEDADGKYYNKLRSDRTPGLYNVDTSTGFELVAQGDTARVYRITACD